MEGAGSLFSRFFVGNSFSTKKTKKKYITATAVFFLIVHVSTYYLKIKNGSTVTTKSHDTMSLEKTALLEFISFTTSKETSGHRFGATRLIRVGKEAE